MRSLKKSLSSPNNLDSFNAILICILHKLSMFSRSLYYFFTFHCNIQYFIQVNRFIDFNCTQFNAQAGIYEHCACTFKLPVPVLIVEFQEVLWLCGGIQQIKENSMLKNTALVDSHIKQHQTQNRASPRVRIGELFLAVLFSVCLKYFFLVGQEWADVFFRQQCT